MARSEARILTNIWEDDDFLDREAGSQRMFMFLLSQDDLAHDGVIALRERRWSQSAKKLTVADVTEALQDLGDSAFVLVDEDTEELLIRSFIRRDKVYRQPNVLRAAADHLPLVKSRKIRAALVIELERVSAEPMSDACAAIIAEMLGTLQPNRVKPSGNPSGNPSENGTDIGPANPSDMGSGEATGTRPGERGSSKTYKDEDSSSPNPVAPSPETLPASTAATRGNRGNRIPDDFAVTEKMVVWAGEHAPNADGRLETIKFINHWSAKSGRDATKLDWVKTWQNWMITAHQRAPIRAAPRHALVEVNGMRLKPETAALVADGDRWAAEDDARLKQQLAIEGQAS